jgi:hypothetical protein
VAAVLVLRAFGPALDRYLPSAKLRRNVTLAVAFAGFGVVAFASSLALLAGDEEAPQGVVALAPLPAARPDKVALEAKPAMPLVESPAIKASMPAILPVCRCPGTDGGDAERDAVAAPNAKHPEVIHAANDAGARTEAPVVATKPESGGAALPSVVVASTPPRAEPALGTEVATPAATAAPTAAETAAANPKAARPQGTHRAYAAAYRRGGHARPRGFFPFFW